MTSKQKSKKSKKRIVVTGRFGDAFDDQEQHTTLEAEYEPSASPARLVKRYTDEEEDFVPSEYQAILFDAIETGTGNVVVKARAGAGKSSSLERCIRLIDEEIIVLAFNRHIRDAMAKRLAPWGHATAVTVHSLGLSTVRSRFGRVDVNPNKYVLWIKELEEEFFEHGTIEGQKQSKTVERWIYNNDGLPVTIFRKLLDIARLNLVHEPSDFPKIAVEYEIDIDPVVEGLVYVLVGKAMEWGQHVPQEVDYVDMIWIPCVRGLKPRKRYPYVFVDECQDLNRAQLELIKKLPKKNGRMLFVGDPAQAIYKFMGADASSFDRIIEETKAVVLPLSICYRCPRSHIELAQKICPDIEAAPWAEEGIVGTVGEGDLPGTVDEGDLILCRMNAPLVSMCFKIIESGLPAVVRGRDIAAGLVAIVDRVEKNSDWSSLGAGIRKWEEKQRANIDRKNMYPEQAALAKEIVSDRASCVLAVAAQDGVVSFFKLKQKIRSIFSDERASVVLSSVHKAKGLEENRVFILKPELLRNPKWGGEQEPNVFYVALTRAKEELWFVEER